MRNRAAELRELHQNFLVLPNAWDVPSARLFAQLPSISALATTSAGIAAAAGCTDGELDSGRMLRAVAEICAAVDVPVSADLESGYDDIAHTVEAALDAGCAGINLEDALSDPGEHAAKIAAAREIADLRGVPLVINARTDVFWRQLGDPATRLDRSIARLRQYAEAGADCVFLPGFPCTTTESPESDIRRLVQELDGTPVNLLASASTPSANTLASWGVRRLTVGSALYRLALASAHHAATTLLATGNPSSLAAADDLSYPQLASLLA